MADHYQDTPFHSFLVRNLRRILCLRWRERMLQNLTPMTPSCFPWSISMHLLAVLQ
ncbi:hypothetical protein LguiA_002977 [Lonicera macranthoides]